MKTRREFPAQVAAAGALAAASPFAEAVAAADVVQTVLGPLAAVRAIITMWVAVICAACAITRGERDELCAEMAAFANAASEGGKHTVRLTTDWGGRFTEPDHPGEQILSAQSCEHDDYAPGRALCAYLLANTSSEFQGINARRALHCIGIEVSGRSPTDDDRLPRAARSHAILGARVRSEVVIEFAQATDDSQASLSISASDRRSR
jgi:hypothetical protein